MKGRPNEMKRSQLVIETKRILTNCLDQISFEAVWLSCQGSGMIWVLVHFPHHCSMFPIAGTLHYWNCCYSLDKNIYLFLLCWLLFLSRMLGTTIRMIIWIRFLFQRGHSPLGRAGWEKKMYHPGGKRFAHCHLIARALLPNYSKRTETILILLFFEEEQDFLK